MKKIALATILTSLSFGAMATAACVDGAAQTLTAGTFIKNVIVPKCSTNVYVDYVENGTVSVGVGAVSKKGKNIFSGNSEGGAVKAAATPCTGATCTGAEAATAASTAAGSS